MIKPLLVTFWKSRDRTAALLLGAILLASAAAATTTPIPVTLSSPSGQKVGAPFTVCARFGDVVNGLTTSSIQVTNGTVANFWIGSRHTFGGGGGYSAALRGDGTLTSWGNNDFNQCNVPAGGGFCSIFTGGTFGFAMRPGGSLVPWGSNISGVFTLPAAQDFLELGLGSDHVIGLRSDGSLAAWGSNLLGQCNVPSEKNFKAVAAASYTSFALRTDGSIAAWGENSLGLLKVPSGNDFVAITASKSGQFAVALRANGSLVFWGNGDSIHSVPAGNDFVAISAGSYHCIALRADGSLAAWGDITAGQCDLTSPDIVGKQFVAIAAGGAHNLALRTDGVLVAWGERWQGDPCAVPNGLAVQSPACVNYCFFDVIPAGLGELSVFIPEGKAHDLSSNPTAASNVLSRTNVGLGTLRVTIDPPAAAAAGAQWRRVGSATWGASGSSETGIISGSYAVELKPLSGRATPPPTTATITTNQITDLHVFQNGLPVISNLAITPAAPTTLDPIHASCTVTDPEGHAITGLLYQWYQGGVLKASGPTLPAGATAKGQVWTLQARAQDELGDWGAWSSINFTIANAPPTQPIVKILPATPTPADDLIVDVQDYSVDPDGDAVGYDFAWYVSRDGGTSWTHKAELDGSSQVSHLYIHDGDLWRVDYTPYEKSASKPGAKPATGSLAATKVIGKPGQDQVYIGPNHQPALSFKTVTGTKWPNGRTTFGAAWSWSDADKDACTVQLYWTDRGAYGLHPLAGPVAAGVGGASGVVTLPGSFPVYLFAVITDAKGAATQATSAVVPIVKGNAADPAWLGRAR